jgi:hypothetical protein
VEKFGNKRAHRHRPTVTFRDHRLQHAPHISEITNSRLNVLEMSCGTVANLGAGIVAAINELQQLTNLLQRKPEFAASFDEKEPAQLRLVVDTMPARGPRRPRQ